MKTDYIAYILVFHSFSYYLKELSIKKRVSLKIIECKYLMICHKNRTRAKMRHTSNTRFI